MIKKVFIILVLSLAAAIAQAQTGQLPLPVDPDTRIGKLENGLTYYIRANAKPAGQADFYIVHDVGAIQEEDSQQGLAHFLEHMAFNGTKNFPGKNLINYLETIGVKFGANLNASTGLDITRYHISNVPTTRQGIIDSALLILHDWSHFILLEDDEIDSERGVIMEELRTRNNASRRIYEKQSPTVYGGSIYSKRNVIGTLEGLKSFSYKEIKDFYDCWYRTDLQAVIVVGDFDPAKMEADVKRIMADIPAAKERKPKQKVVIPDNKEPLVVITKDPEQTVLKSTIMYRRAALPNELNSTEMAYRNNLIFRMARFMGGVRFQELQQKPDAKFLEGSLGNTQLIPGYDVLRGGCISHDGKAMEGFKAFCEEVERIRRYGFTPAEFELVKKLTMRNSQQSYIERDNRRHRQFVMSCISHFRENTPLLSAEEQWKLDSTLISQITLKEVNSMLTKLIVPENVVVTMALPEAETAPTEDQIRKVLHDVRNAKLEKPVERKVAKNLISRGTKLPGSEVVKSETDIFGATVWTLKNGARIVIMPTNYSKDAIYLYAASEGGTSIATDDEYMTAMVIDDIVQMSGVDKFSKMDLRHQLAGKSASVGLGISEFQSSLSGSSSVKDLETMMQLLYLQFTSPRFNKSDFDAMIAQNETYFHNMAKDPKNIMQDSIASALYPGDKRKLSPKAEDMQKVNFDLLPALHKKLYGGIQNYIFTIIGNVDLDTLKPLVEKYIGSVPATGEIRKWHDSKTRMVKGVLEKRFRTSMLMPKTSVSFTFSGNMPYTLENRMVLNALSQVLRMRYTAVIREEKGGSYSVGCQYSMNRLPENTYRLRVSFDTNEEQANELMEVVTDELRKMADNGPDEESIAKIREYMHKQYLDDITHNSQWLSILFDYHFNGVDTYTGYQKAIDALTPEKVRAMAAGILSDGNQLKVVMNPER